MPPVGGFVALCVKGGSGPGPLMKAEVTGDFFKIEFVQSTNTLKGKLIIYFESYRICHQGVKVCLVGDLMVGDKRINIFKNCPTENILLPAGELLRQKRLKFNLTLRPDQAYPSPFITSNGSLEYRIRALIKRHGVWETLGYKLVNFKGYSNVRHMGVSPFEESKIIQTKVGKIISTFRVPNTVAIMGQCDSFEGILELQGVEETEVNATITFFRSIIYGKLINTEVISSQNRQAEVNQKNVSFNWTVVVPVLKRISFSNESDPQYSVRYYLKYEVFMGLGTGDDKQHATINGSVEVQIGTTRDPIGATHDGDIDDSANGATGSQTTIGIYQNDKCKSVVSLMSMLSLPPAYSQLSSRRGSMMSLEISPPRYDELENV